MKKRMVALLLICLLLVSTTASAASLLPNMNTTANQSEEHQTFYLALGCLDGVVLDYRSIDLNIADIRSYCAYIRVPTTERISYECNRESVCLVFEINFNDLAVIQIVSEGVDIKKLLPYCTSNQPVFSKSEDTLEIIIDEIAYYVPCENFLALFEGVLIARKSLKLPSPYAWDELDDACINIPVNTGWPMIMTIFPEGLTPVVTPIPNMSAAVYQSESYQTLCLAVKCLDDIVVPQSSIASNIAEIRSYCAAISTPTSETISYKCNQESICLVFEINFNDLAAIQIVSEGVDIKTLLPYGTSNQPAFSRPEDILEVTVDENTYYVPCEDFIALFQNALIDREALKTPSRHGLDKSDDAFDDIPVNRGGIRIEIINPEGLSFIAPSP